MSLQSSKPDWRTHITFVDSRPKNKLLKCKFCNLDFQGNGTRAVNHLAGTGSGIRSCTDVPPALRTQFYNMLHPSKLWRKRRLKEKETHAANNGALHPFRHEQVCISFLSLENPHFVNFCNTLNPRYNPPSRRVVSSSKLDEADRKITE